MISILEYFLLGIIFCSVIVPLIDGFTSTLLQGLEVINGIFKVIITKQSLKMTQLKEEALEPKNKVRTIGFSYEALEEEEVED